MLDFGYVKPGTTLYVPFSSFGTSGASITLTGLATTDIEIYKDGSVTQRASDAGYTLLDTDGIDFDGITGLHGFSVNLADNSTAGFYAAGSQYWLVVSTVTVDSQTVTFIACTFRIGHEQAVLNTTIATLSTQTSFTLTAGPAEDDALNGMWLIVHDVASAVQQAAGIISDYTGSTKTVTLAAAPTFTIAATDNISVMGPMPLQPTTAGRTLTIESDGMAHADAKEWLGGTIATPTVTGVPEVDPTHWRGTALAAPGTAGVPAVDVVRINNTTGAPAVLASWLGGGVVGTLDDNPAANTLSYGVSLGSAAVVTGSLIVLHTAGGEQTYVVTSYTEGTGDFTVYPNPSGAGGVSGDAFVLVPAPPWRVGSIANDTITASSIASNAITSAKIATDAIGAAQIAANAITSSELADGAITAAKIATDAITADKIAADAIGSSELAATAVNEIADQVWDEAIAGHLTAGSTGEKLNSAGNAGDPWGTDLPGSYAGADAGAILNAIYGAVSHLATGGVTFYTSPAGNVLPLIQGHTYLDGPALTIAQPDSSWPDLSTYPQSGTNGLFLELTIVPEYTSHASYVANTNRGTFSIAGTYSGTGANQTLAFRPGTQTTLLIPTTKNYPAYPYITQAKAYAGTNRKTLFSGLSSVLDDASTQG